MLKEHIITEDGMLVDILDVASGPMTWIGKKFGTRKLCITAIDALADDYNRLLAEAGVVPLVRTRAGTVEDLSRYFDPDKFDLVFCKNALDHSKNPVLGIKQMLRCTKPGCSVLLMHHRNVGEYANYAGLHQWNFDLRDGFFVIWNRRGVKNVSQIFQDECEVKCWMGDGETPLGDIFVSFERRKPQ